MQSRVAVPIPFTKNILGSLWQHWGALLPVLTFVVLSPNMEIHYCRVLSIVSRVVFLCWQYRTWCLQLSAEFTEVFWAFLIGSFFLTLMGKLPILSVVQNLTLFSPFHDSFLLGDNSRISLLDLKETVYSLLMLCYLCLWAAAWPLQLRPVRCLKIIHLPLYHIHIKSHIWSCCFLF